MKLYKKFSLLLLSLVLTACSGIGDDSEKLPTDPNELYREGVEQLNKGKYSDAAAAFEKLEKEHPVSNNAPEAQIRRAYAHYLNAKYDEAEIVIEDFIKQHPNHRSTPYMFYLKALCYFDQIVDVGREQQLTKIAIDKFQELINRYPNTQYAKDAKLKIEFAQNNLAGKEMEIGHFYLKQNYQTAAMGRYRYVIEKYQTTIFAPEALYRMTEIYYNMGDAMQAQKYASVLGYNYPDSEWYRAAYNLLKNTPNGDENEGEAWYSKISKVW